MPAHIQDDRGICDLQQGLRVFRIGQRHDVLPFPSGPSQRNCDLLAAVGGQQGFGRTHPDDVGDLACCTGKNFGGKPKRLQ